MRSIKFLLPAAYCLLPTAFFLSILQHKDMTIFIVAQMFCRKNDYFFSR